MKYIEQEQDLQFRLLQKAQARRQENVVYRPGTMIVAFLANLTLGTGAFMLAYFARYNVFAGSPDALELAPVTQEGYLGLGMLYSLVLATILHTRLFMNPGQGTKLSYRVLTTLNATLVSAALVSLGIALIFPQILYSRLVFVYLIPATVALLEVKHQSMRLACQQGWLPGPAVRNLLVVGATNTGVQVMRAAAENSHLNYNLLGFVDDQLRFADWTLPVRYGNSVKRGNKEVPHLGSTSHLAQLLNEYSVDRVIITLPVQYHQTINRVMEECRRFAIPFKFVPDTSEAVLSFRDVQQVLATEPQTLPGAAAAYSLKRVVDIFGVLTGLLILGIPMLLVALLIRLDSKGPVLFRQTRVGKGGKNFTFYKFRSMYIDAEQRLTELQKLNEVEGATFKMKNDPRVTRVGRFIRRTSLDELPQLINVLFGQMSLVGPRPGIPREIARYQPWHLRRLEVTPGLTGLWQVNGRSLTTFDEMVKLDVYYIEHWSFWMDIRIIFKTIQAIFKGEGAF